MQTRSGKRESTEAFGRRTIRPFMPDQHRQFFGQLPFAVFGSVDGDRISGHKGETLRQGEQLAEFGIDRRFVDHHLMFAIHQSAN